MNVNKDSLHNMTTYIFSRCVISNADELSIDLVGMWEGKHFDSPYNIYLYRTYD